MAQVMDVLRFRSKTKSEPMVLYPQRNLWAWQGQPSEGAQGKDAKSKETEGFSSGKGTTQDIAETKSEIKDGGMSAGKDDGDQNEIVAPKGAPNLNIGEPKGAANIIT